MRVGVTGWKGFIGSHLVNRLDNPVLFDGDMRNPAKVIDFTRQCDRIYHLAGKNREDDGVLMSNNLISTGNLVLAVRKTSPPPEVVFISSTQVEQNPVSEYGFTKSVEEYMVRKLPKWLVIRTPNVYGPGCRPYYNSVVATFAYQITHGESVTINNPGTTRQFVYIDDFVSTLLAIVESGEQHKTLTVAGEVLSIGEVYELLTTRLGEHEKLKRCLDSYRGL